MGLTVSDLERSVRFYRNELGFELRNQWTRSEAYVRELLGYPDLELHAAILRVPGDGSIVELVEYRGVDRTAIDATHANPGTCHLSLFVDDLDTLVDGMRSRGVRFVSEPVTPTVGPNEGGRAVYLLDPDGIRVELTQSSRPLDA